mmetsp:Transcript_8857/g.18892  ORF Transcript_8857/g.18892 Transcript_8857/m.18892 type:complete len:91 (-) Transcript_8857:211-483(-)
MVSAAPCSTTAIASDVAPARAQTIAFACAFALALLFAGAASSADDSCALEERFGLSPDNLAAGAEAFQVLVVFSLSAAAGKAAHSGLSIF